MLNNELWQIQVLNEINSLIENILFWILIQILLYRLIHFGLKWFFSPRLLCAGDVMSNTMIDTMTSPPGSSSSIVTVSYNHLHTCMWHVFAVEQICFERSSATKFPLIPAKLTREHSFLTLRMACLLRQSFCCTYS